MYYSTHQFYLSRRSIYLCIFDFTDPDIVAGSSLFCLALIIGLIFAKWANTFLFSQMKVIFIAFCIGCKV